MRVEILALWCHRCKKYTKLDHKKIPTGAIERYSEFYGKPECSLCDYNSTGWRVHLAPVRSGNIIIVDERKL